ncbi:Abi family protein [Gleimia hominis]|uniref:Abi family protein n=1 Tax=Gleimia hominis TaxID=595468 RepID=A0ABU3I828_9ACTO|nr:Abi family protein [Gleimia hominis]MDT3766531.1 Abi family protein [Gleimia hominis]
MDVDEEQAQQWLANVGYYRLSAYWYPARVQTDAKRGDNFMPGISFSDAAALYEADRKLRALVLDGLERVEVAVRAHISAQICASDPLGYKRPEIFRSHFDYKAWMSTAHKRVARAKTRSEFIRHYDQNYRGLYPFWVLAEVLDFSDISKLYAGLKAELQIEIADSFGISIDYGALSRAQRRKALANPPLVRWLQQLTVIRNICAHHGRLWNKSFIPVPTASLRTIKFLQLLPEGQSERTFGALHLIAFLLRTTSPGSTWSDKITKLIKESFLTSPLVSPESLGIPKDQDKQF